MYCHVLSTDNLHSPIELEDGKRLLVGRGPLTKITTKKCSREQVELIADYKSQEVHLKVVGKNPSRVASKKLKKGDEYILGAGGRFELISKYSYCIFFGKRLDQQLQLNDCNTSVGADSTEEDGSSLEQKSVKRMKLDDSSNKDMPRCKNKSSTTLESFFGVKPSATKQAEPHYHECDTLLIFRYGPQCPSDKIAAFDLDGTLISTLSGKKFANDHSDWKLMPHVKDKLKELHRSGHRIVILTNQGGLSKGKPTKDDFKKKMNAIATELDLPLLVMAASDQDVYRKPCTGMWNHIIEKENGEVLPNLSHSFYVGDAAGRSAEWKPGAKKDFSCTDRKFASNVGIHFETPEEFFLGSRKCSKFSWGDFDPRKCVLGSYSPEIDPPGASLIKAGPEVVVFVGFPASGKTTFYETVMKCGNYIHVNRDILGTWQKCVALCEQQLLNGRKVVVDNTNPDIESRSRYISCAQKHGVPVRCFQFMTTLAQAKHNNKFRELTTNSRSDRKKVTEIAYNTFKSRFVQPSIIEGFTEVIKVTVNPCVDKEYAALYTQFLL